MNGNQFDKNGKPKGKQCTKKYSVFTLFLITGGLRKYAKTLLIVNK
jgi:hypothetical protein